MRDDALAFRVAEERTGAVRVIALRRATAEGVDWSPGDNKLAPQDRVCGLATRAWLGQVLARSQP